MLMSLSLSSEKVGAASLSRRKPPFPRCYTENVVVESPLQTSVVFTSAIQHLMCN